MHSKCNGLSLIQYNYSTIGRQPCLWCCIPSSELKVPPQQRRSWPFRTLDSLHQDHQRFMAAGGDFRKVKHFNNSIAQPLFNIEVNQVLCTYTMYMYVHKIYTLNNYTHTSTGVLAWVTYQPRHLSATV